MNFLLSEQQQEIQRAVGRVLGECCDSQRLHRVFDGNTGFDALLWESLAHVGVTGLQLPQELGGAGLDMIDLAIVAEVLGAAAAPTPFLGHSLASLAILLAGSDDQKQRWLPKLATGQLIGTIAFSEGEQRWQPNEWTLASGSRLNGRKSFVTFAPQAGLIVVGTQGPGLAVVEAGAPGLVIESIDSIDRTRRFSHLTFADTPAEVLAEGTMYADRVRDAALVLLAADAFGGASHCVQLAIEYAKVREQYDVSIAKFQALKHQLANMAVDVEPARALYWYAAHAFDAIPSQSARAAAMAKAHLADRYLQVVRDTVEAHGGVGYTWEHDVQIYFKRAMFDFAYLGQPASHRARCAVLAGW